MDDIYTLWIHNIKGIGKKRIDILLDYYGAAKKVFHTPGNELQDFLENQTLFSKENITRLLESRNIEKVIQYRDKLLKAGIHFISPNDEEYPDKLKSIYYAPGIIYYKGNIPDQNQVKIAMVGARNCTPYGKRIATMFAKELALHNVVVVSGMARGIDTAAHLGALEGGGSTVAVLGCGVNVCYPKENRNLMNQIINQGAVMSEIPVDAAPIAGNFPLRNRIISGLCDGVLIIEAANKSGSLITMDFALEQGRDVFAVPGRIMDPACEGSNRLLKMGAKPVTCVEDILEEYPQCLKNDVVYSEGNKTNLEGNEKIIFECITDEPVSVDQLIIKTGLMLNELQLALIKLEIMGLVEKLPRQQYVGKGR